MRIVNVTDLETRPFSGESSWTECRYPAFVSDLRQGVRLVHELGQLIGPEEGVHDRGKGLGIDEVRRRKDFVVPNVHPFADRPGHPGQSDAELVVELFADGPDPPVAQVVDIVDLRSGIDQFDQVGDDGDDVLVGEDLGVLGDIEVQLLIDPIPPDLTKVITGLGEEELVDDPASGLFVGRLRVPELPIDMLDRLLLGVGGILLERVVDDVEIGSVDILPVEDDRLRSRFHDLLDVLLFEDGLPVDHDLVPLDGDHFTRVFVHEILDPGAEHPCCQFAAEDLLEVRFVDLHLFGKAEDVEDVLIAFIADRPEERGHRELLLPVDVGVHHVVDVRREFDPGAFEGDHSGGVELGPVCVKALAEEDTGRTVQLGDDDPFRPVDHEGSFGGHVRDRSQVNVLNDRFEVLVLRVRTVELQLGLQGHGIGQSALDTLFDRIARRIDEVIEELQHELVARIRDRKVLVEDLEKSFLLTVLGVRFQLEELAEGAKLDLEEIRVFDLRVGGREVDPFWGFFQCCQDPWGFGSKMVDRSAWRGCSNPRKVQALPPVEFGGGPNLGRKSAIGSAIT